jgi:hypothetical protein
VSVTLSSLVEPFLSRPFGRSLSYLIFILLCCHIYTGGGKTTWRRKNRMTGVLRFPPSARRPNTRKLWCMAKESRRHGVGGSESAEETRGRGTEDRRDRKSAKHVEKFWKKKKAQKGFKKGPRLPRAPCWLLRVWHVAWCNYLAPGWFNFSCGANYPHQALKGGYFVFVWGVVGT